MLALAVYQIFSFLALLIDAAPSAQEKCGKPVGRNGRIIGGENAKLGEFPFLASLHGPEEPQATETSHKCGGALLNKRWILTAAHCVAEYRTKRLLDRLKVRLGLHDINGTKSGSEPQDIGVEFLAAHPRYREPHRMSNDIALLRLKQDVTFTDFVWPICLPDPSKDITGMEATVAGWGRTNMKLDGTGFSAEILQKVKVPVLSNSACKEMFKRAGQSYPLEPNVLCAGYSEGGKDSCEGDSGGPLFVEQNGVFTVIGVVSNGIECGSPLLPGIYTRVISHLPWILNEMKR